MSSSVSDAPKTTAHALTLTALGIVFGDIGTSPLYAVREAFHGPHSMPPTPQNILGVLSLIVWALILVISLKYLLFVLRADNKGEGGVLALTALAAPPRFCSKYRWSRFLLYLGLLGASFLFGDGVVTPAISVLSAVEGLKVATPFFDPFVIPLTISILAGLFFSQSLGTAKIGSVFGPIILFWFLTIGALGLNAIIQDPTVIKAVNPYYAYDYFVGNGWSGFIVLGAVLLVVTGGEALYADMGHFGAGPIKRAWFWVALPCLLLNYFGQSALLLGHPAAVSNPFFLLAPSWALYPLVILAAMAAVIASQALISGLFSLTRQAVQLGYFPRFKIIHTSSEEIGQIYIPHINWMLFIATCFAVFEFGSSSALAAAYGIAVSLTMLVTTILVCSVALQRWRWSWPATLLVLLVLLTIDLSFLGANATKIADGGWFPLVISGIVFTLMTTWRRGRQILRVRLREKTIPLSNFLEQIQQNPPVKISGSAIFMTGDPEGTPLALMHNVKHNKCLHGKNALLTVVAEQDAHISKSERVHIRTIRTDFYRIVARYGFMQRPDIYDILSACAAKGLHIDIADTTFYLGRETLIASSNPGMAIWREHVFAFMTRNSERATAYFNIPVDQVVEVGIQIEI